ncbi:hypothetical protein E2K98_29630 [Bacillus salipaludis]|uniref:DUF3953 domain-containing protein n=1 Tax=Bacillus salipaludis TaxID=2547811 RepID=A0A4R5VJA0_9BACI|nr:hypothetical protein [Bacillus salipaludis]TDK54191.1 hypothetical protein E2K98_29630 [Bacillus salipaludis]
MVKLGFYLAGIIIILTIYTAISHNFRVIPYTEFLSGCMLIILGVLFIRIKRKGIGTFLFVASGITFICLIGLIWG